VSAADGTRSSANQISVAVQSSREHELERVRGLRQSQRSSSRSQPLQREMNKNTVPPATMGTSTTQSIHPTMTTTAKTTTTANDNNANAIQTNGKPRSPPRDPRPSRIQYSSSRISPEPVVSYVYLAFLLLIIIQNLLGQTNRCKNDIKKKAD
jgi:hypothetical protein